MIQSYCVVSASIAIADTLHKTLGVRYANRTRHAYQRHELHARCRILQKATEQATGRGPGTRLFYAAVAHAKMLTLQDHADAGWLKNVIDCFGNLRSEF